MITIYCQSTHLKVFYENATTEEKEKSENLLREKFCAEDATLKHSFAVKKGWQSAIHHFYIPEHQLLPIGFLGFLTQYYTLHEIEYEVKDMRKWAKINKPLLKKIITDQFSINKYTPRDYQREAVLAAVTEKIGVLSIPMGGGKTFIAYLLTQVYSTSKILLMFHKIDLVLQTRDAFINEYKMSESEVGVIQGKNFEDDKRVTLLSVASYEQAFHLFPEVQVIICDEAHGIGSGLSSEMATRILYACQNAANRFGLSATPDVIDNKARQMALYGNLGHVIYKRDMQEQIREDVLAKLTVAMHRVVVDDEIRVTGSYADVYEKIRIKKTDSKEDYIKDGWEIITEDGKEYARKFLRDGDETTHYVTNDARNKQIAKLAKQNKRVMILFTRKEHGKALKKYLPDAMLVDGDNTVKEREAAKNFLKEHEDNIIIASTIFGQGVDLPWIHTLILAGGGRGTVAVIQRFGRITRKDKGTNKNTGKVIDFYDDFSPLGRKQSERRKTIYETELGFNVEVT